MKRYKKEGHPTKEMKLQFMKLHQQSLVLSFMEQDLAHNTTITDRSPPRRSILTRSTSSLRKE
jgi:hypothetical protein